MGPGPSTDGAGPRPGPSRPDPAARARRLAGAAIVRTLVWSTRLVALLMIAYALLPAPRRILGEPLRSSLALPHTARLAGIVITMVAAVGLMLLATGLRRRKRRAWTVAVGVTGLLTIVNLPHGLSTGHGLVAALTSAGLLAAFIACRRYFVARPDPGGLTAGLVLFGQLALAGFALVWLLLAINHQRLVGAPGPQDEAVHAALSLVGVSGPVLFRAAWLDDLTSTVGLSFGIAAVLVAAYCLLRSPEPRPVLTADDESRLRALLDRHGERDSLGYFALRRDKAAVFSPSGKAAVAYRVLAGVALASGDPVGDVEAWPGAIELFLAECTGHGWVPAVLACSERGATAWARAGLDALELGDEAVLDARSFSLEGRPMRGIRQAAARVRRAGYAVRVRRVAELDDGERTGLAALASTWRGDAAERGYSMALSRMADAADPNAVVVTAERGGAVRGLLQFVPWGREGLSLDLMRRDPAADNGLNELMIVELMAAAPGLGVARVSLNFAVFRAALERGERIGAGPVARLWARILRIASRFWQIDSLYRFNAKFRPEWAPRFLVFPTARDLPRILVAALEAEGFGGRPPLVLRLLRR
ncbi:phosphatidylglycerol lysyltransferase domain-containing protein [Pseudonocardia hispaniensis]|uniref:Phosphatidylglycerol lysyltransferase domain-containing protein n=1 Tax=Pseudonocardia hispaniensis TaxID=904933 RepID=A0ABW1IWL0_9PSEU